MQLCEQIIRKIFLELPKHDLLSCSLVNKAWYKESRSVMMEFREVSISTPGDTPCAYLIWLNEELKRSDTILLNGLCIRIVENEHDCLGRINIHKHYEAILSKLKVKYLTIDWDPEIPWMADVSWEDLLMVLGVQKKMFCPAVQLITELLKKTPNELEELHVTRLPLWARLFTSEDKEEGKVVLSKLKILEVSSYDTHLNETEVATRAMWEPGNPDPILPRPMIPDLIAVAPNLQELRKDIDPGDDIDEALPARLSHLIKNVYFSPTEPAEELPYEKLARRNLQLNTVWAFLRVVNHLNRSCWLALKQMLISSQNSLERFDFDAYIGSMLRPLNIPALPNLRDVTLSIDFGPWATQVRAELLHLNFTKIFPNVETVELNPYTRRISDFVDFRESFNEEDEANPVDQHGGESKTARIKEVLVSLCIQEDDEDYVSYISMLGYIFQLFPQTVELFLQLHSWDIPYEYIWTSAASFTMVSLDYRHLPDESDQALVDLDAQFCGVSPEEMALLREMDDEYLKTVNIVPIKASVVNSSKSLKGLSCSWQNGDCRGN